MTIKELTILYKDFITTQEMNTLKKIVETEGIQSGSIAFDELLKKWKIRKQIFLNKIDKQDQDEITAMNAEIRKVIIENPQNVQKTFQSIWDKTKSLDSVRAAYNFYKSTFEQFQLLELFNDEYEKFTRQHAHQV